MIHTDLYLFSPFLMDSSSPQTSNPWFAVSMGLIGLIVGYILATGMNGFAATGLGGGGNNNGAPIVDNTAPPLPPPTNDTPADPDDDPVLGKADAPITLIEFTDYQCPFCSRHFTQTYAQIKKEYIDTGKVKYVLRDFPLGFHPNAQKAAEASECADDQGKFWEMHDMLFNKQQEWSNLPSGVETFKKYAADLKLNAGTFNECLDSGKHQEETQKDMAAGSASGIDGTPGFWILGPDGQTQKISGAYPFETFKSAFDAML